MILSFTDTTTGQPRQVVVRAGRFQIGRSPDNDLAVADSNLSRRHALIETSGGSAQISDCGSSNGTTVNGQPVNAHPVVLREGDRITLGGSLHLTVSLRADNFYEGAATGGSVAAVHPSVPQPAYGMQGQSAAAPPSNVAAQPRVASLPSWLSLPLIAALAAGFVIILAAVLLYALTRGSNEANLTQDDNDTTNSARRSADENDNTNSLLEDLKSDTDETSTLQSAEISSILDEATNNAGGDSTTNVNSARDDSSNNATETAPVVSSAPDSTEQIERATKRVMSRISTDNTPYISEGGVRDVAAKVKAYRGSSTLQEKLQAMERGCAEVRGQAQGVNLKPTLVMYAALAQSESAGGDPVAVARQMMPKLLTLRATFGTATANSSLLLVAAYPYPFNPEIGSQSRTAHPLYTQLIRAGGQKSNVETSIARSVWFLREQGQITPEAYDLAVRLLAIGIIAQNPKQYGINADPLLC